MTTGLPLTTQIDCLMIGRAVPFGPNGERSAIDKDNIEESLPLGLLGFLGDEHGDLIHHGGNDKAVHHYPCDHYVIWRNELPDVLAERWQPGAFGENLVTTGITEKDICIGDIFLLGTALVQVSQARQPCWKLNERFGVSDMALRVQNTGMTGWYYRVIQPGKVIAGASLSLVERFHPEWTLSRLLHFFYQDPLNREALTAISNLELLTLSWRNLARLRLENNQVENSDKRLYTPGIL
jgi:MOSC domain-containing protein YiiM